MIWFYWPAITKAILSNKPSWTNVSRKKRHFCAQLMSCQLWKTRCGFVLSEHPKLKDGPLEKWWRGGEFSGCTNFFFLLTTCARFFLSGETLRSNIFFKQTLLFSQWNLDSLSFLCFINYSTLTRDQTMRAIFLIMCGRFFLKMYWEEEVALNGRLAFAFL